MMKKKLHIKSDTYERIANEILDSVDVGVPYVSGHFIVEQDDDAIEIMASMFLYWKLVHSNPQYGLPFVVLTHVVPNWYDVFADGRPTDFDIEALIKRMIQ